MATSTHVGQPDFNQATSTHVGQPDLNGNQPDPKTERTGPMDSIVKLPVELLIKIFDSADPMDLGNVRLTCMQFCEISTEIFGKARLTQRRFTFSEHGLQALVDLTAHPILGKCIKEISVGALRVESDLVKIMDGMHHLNLDSDSAKMTLLKDCYDSVTLQRCLQSTGLRLIQKALENLRYHGQGSNKVAIGVFKDIVDESSAVLCGLPAGYRQGGYGCEEAFAAHTTHGLWSFAITEMQEIIEEAARNARFTPSFFTFSCTGDPFQLAHNHYWIWRTYSSDRSLEPIILRRMQTPLGPPNSPIPCVRVNIREKVLNINLRDGYMEWRHMIPAEVCMGTLDNLQMLPCYGPFADFLRIPRLQEIKIQNCVVSGRSIGDLLHHQAPTLRRLTLRGVCVRAGVPYPQDGVLEIILELNLAPNLEYVHVDRIGYFQRGSPSEQIACHKGTWQGKEQIATCVDDLTRMVKRSDPATSYEERMRSWDDQWGENKEEKVWW